MIRNHQKLIIPLQLSTNTWYNHNLHCSKWNHINNINHARNKLTKHIKNWKKNHMPKMSTENLDMPMLCSCRLLNGSRSWSHKSYLVHLPFSVLLLRGNVDSMCSVLHEVQVRRSKLHIHPNYEIYKVQHFWVLYGGCKSFLGPLQLLSSERASMFLEHQVTCGHLSEQS